MMIPSEQPPEAADPLLTQTEPPVRVPLTIEKVLAALAMAALCLITLANVVARYLTNYSFAFTEEYSIFLMVVVTLLGSSVAVAANRHIRIGYFVERFKGRNRLAAEIVAEIAVAAMFLLLVLLGGRLVWDEYRYEVTSPGLGEPQWIYTIALPLLSLLILGRALGRIVRIAKGRP